MCVSIPGLLRTARPLGLLFSLAYVMAATGDLAAAVPNHPLEEKYWRGKTHEPHPDDLPPASYSFPYPANPLGWSAYSGEVSLWVNGNWKVTLGGEETLPLRFRFTSGQDRVADGLLGKGWWIPLLESRVLLRYDGSAMITALGGESKFIYHHREIPGTLRSRNRQWQAVGRIEGRLEVTGPGGWIYRYEHGRIVAAVSPGGRELRWIYDGNDRVEALVDGEGKTVLELSLNAGGRIESLRIAGGASFEMDYGGIPLFLPDGGGTVYSGSSESARTIAEFDPGGRRGRVVGLRVSAFYDGNYRALYTGTRSDGIPERRRLEWSSLPGKRILSDGESLYFFDRWIDGIGHRRGAILRTFGDDECEYYHYDARSKIDLRIRRDGTAWERSYHGKSGPTHMKLSRTREGRYSAGRVIFHKERLYQYDELGGLVR